MRDRDLADSSLASEWPDIAGAVDSLADRAREALAPFIPAPERARAFAALDAVLAADADAAPACHGEKLQLVFETLRAIYGDTRLPPEVRRQAVAAAIGANDPYFSKAYEYYANQFAVTRACIHSKARDVQRRFGLRARRDKCDSARGKSKANATGPRTARAPLAAVQRKSARSVFTFFPGI